MEDYYAVEVNWFHQQIVSIYYNQIILQFVTSNLIFRYEFLLLFIKQYFMILLGYYNLLAIHNFIKRYYMASKQCQNPESTQIHSRIRAKQSKEVQKQFHKTGKLSLTDELQMSKEKTWNSEFFISEDEFNDPRQLIFPKQQSNSIKIVIKSTQFLIISKQNETIENSIQQMLSKICLMKQSKLALKLVIANYLKEKDYFPTKLFEKWIKQYQQYSQDRYMQ